MSWINAIIFGTSLSHASNNLVSGMAWQMTAGDLAGKKPPQHTW